MEEFTIKPFTDEDEERLENLKQEFEDQKRLDKLNIFKGLPHETRELIISQMKIANTSDMIYEINNRSYTQEIQELERHKMLSEQAFGYNPVSNTMYKKAGREMPYFDNPFYDFNLQELEEANADASIEEEILKK